MTHPMRLASLGGATTATAAEAIDFDGTNDYLTRSTDLTGNADTSTFTMSLWVYVDETPASSDQLVSIGGGNLELTMNSSRGLTIVGFNGTQKLSSSTDNNVIALKTWTNILISVDMSNVCMWSINDVTPGSNTTTLVNSTIDVTNTPHRIAGVSTQIFKGRLANVYLDYTYRNLLTVANRRLFITADLKPAAGQAALNPILYLPMNDPTAPGTNAGTGGNFTLTGTVARSGRGPNQYNAPYSDLDGSGDYLSRTTAPTGLADGKQFTFHCAFSTDNPTTTQYITTFATSTSDRFYVYVFGTSSELQVIGINSAGTTILVGRVTSPLMVANRNYVVQVSVDLASTATRHIYVNGQAATVAWDTYTNDTIDFAVTTTPRYRVGINAATTPSNYFNGRLGALWFNTSYIDLSQPANLAKFVTGTGIDAKPVDLGASGELPTGSSPLIYLPMYGNNAGKNYGTGGDFTVNSGPYTGARGPNEFWGNVADFDGTTGYLSRASALTGVSAGNKFLISFIVQFDAVSSFQSVISINTNRFHIQLNSGNTISFRARTAANATLLDATTTSTFASGTKYFIQACFDLSDTNKRFVYVNNVLETMTWTSYVDGSAGLDNSPLAIANRSDAAQPLNGRLSELFFASEYIDFSLESNRLKFRDAFGNPTDLPSAITAQSVPNPAIYMRFPPTSFGTNSGTGGNFTVNGTITDGGQL